LSKVVRVDKKIWFRVKRKCIIMIPSNRGKVVA
jgi:hypothetical protein